MTDFRETNQGDLKKRDDYPIINSEQYNDFLDYRTGKDSFIEFTGFIGDDEEKRFADLYRLHDEFPELGDKSNLSLTLKGSLSGRARKTAASIVDFEAYEIIMGTGRPFQELPGTAVEPASTIKKENGEYEFHNLFF